MKVNFIGGDDVQRSLNHSDNRCVNLVPALNDKGDIAAFYGAAGLTLEYTNPSSAVGSGIYTASNGRAFEVAGTTLYELIDTAGVISTTSRGTVTSASIYRMTDNGIEMLLVNGTDGWLFTFATNALTKIKVASDTFTVTIANPAVFTQTDHGLVAGDAIRLTSTTGSIVSDTLLTALSPATISGYGDNAAVAPANDFVYVAGSTSIYQYLRNTSTGALSALSPATVSAASGAFNFTLSRDGISAYTSTFSIPSAVETWNVNTTTGQITASAYADQNISNSVTFIYVAPNDDFVYVLDSQNGRIYQFSRAVTGELTALSPAYISTVANPQAMCISSDGLFSYVAGVGGSISVHARNNTTGLITQTPVETKVTSSSVLSDIIISNDDAHIYTADGSNSTVSMFSRNTGTGVLTALSPATITSSGGANSIVISADDSSVYVTNYSANTVSMYVRDTSTGILTATSTATIATGTYPYDIVISPDDTSVYVPNSASTVSMYSRNSTATSVGLPTGLSENTTYYVISAGLTADNFEVSETLGGTAVSTSGQQAGVHTYTTLGYGFPEGAKTCAYMNGRFIACEPSTQNFYVSEVLDGKWWDALNVQTVDSNPDYVIGETVSHNELIVFCQDSGEVFYDSGETPSPFVRNTSGIFEVGCVAPYSICNLDNQVFWLGGNKNGQGVIYKLQGFTPIRISTHSIEYAIQSMTDFTDARAFSYQQDGHHFYVITFPTGNKTYVYDVNTGLWHERAEYSGSFTRWIATEHAYFADKHLVLGTDGKIYSLHNDVYAYGSNPRRCLRSFQVPAETMERMRHTRLMLDCEIGTSGGGTITGGSVSSVSIINSGTSGDQTLTLAAQTLPSNLTWTGIAWNGTVFCAVASNSATCATSPDGVTWTSRTGINGGWNGIAWNGSVFCVVGTGTNAATSPDGITWTARTLPSSASSWDAITYGNGIFVAVGYTVGTTEHCATSADGISWTSRTMNSGTGVMRPRAVTWSGSMFVVVGNLSGGAGIDYAFSSPDGITWTDRTLPSAVVWRGVAHDGTRFYAVATTTVGATSTDGITWAAATLPASATWTAIAASGATLVAVNTSGTAYTTDDGGATWASAGGGGTMSSITVGGTVWSAVGTGTSAYTGSFGYPLSGTYALTFTGGGGSAAAGTYTISSTTGQITSTAITNSGSGYTSTPTVSFAYGGISGASGVANMVFTYSESTESSIPVGMRYSDDAGRSWSAMRYGYLSDRGVVWHRLGMTKGLPRIYEISMTDAEKITLLNVHLD